MAATRKPSIEAKPRRRRKHPTNMFAKNNMPSAQTVMSTAASFAASAMTTLIIEEFDGLTRNQIYKAAEIYLGTKTCSSMKLCKFKWRQVTRQVESKNVVFEGQSSNVRSEKGSFELSFHKKHKEKVLDSYLPFVLKDSKRLMEEKKTLKLHTLGNDYMRRYVGGAETWQPIKLDHPANFGTLAMNTELKATIMEDLERFVKRKDYYRRVGKAWKRGYLLYGPPGTGKSSLIAAMANYLNFDIYDLELTDIHTNSDLRRVLIATGNRSILVVEDIDCGLELHDRQTEPQPGVAIKPNRTSQVTLSGLLNFIDGLWSSCGDERIIVFTTSHKDRLDPALLRPGRMDVHIHMSYCSPSGFDTLAVNYLGVNDHHPLMSITRELLAKTSVTPAEVDKQLLKNEDPEAALKGLIDFLQQKVKEEVEVRVGDKS
ncbi:hypothetical protein CXB51_007223 [Gossypium anomalum]|uniref:AAA+ ATPase domain-containing protein n=1 Tax=Gossypium anomalum TaxID=47600 RepID=A0A8J6D7F9_9ROSI|nr:hypothetical protein CXB51_007223 [Gossypium anomalum]